MRLSVGLIIIGDEILSGRRQDQHLSHSIEMLKARGLSLSWAQILGDEPQRITEALVQARRQADEGAVVFCCGGIGATPDDHTRDCAGAAWGQAMRLHPQAYASLMERMQDLAKEAGKVFDPALADTEARRQMAVFPEGAQIIPNPYNKIAGFFMPAARGVGGVYFLPGFPVMAWPMMAWVLDELYADFLGQDSWSEKSCIVQGAMEASLTPLMVSIEAQHPGVKVFSLPSVDHPLRGKHIELGVKGEDAVALGQAWDALWAGLIALGHRPEVVAEDKNRTV